MYGFSLGRKKGQNNLLSLGKLLSQPGKGERDTTTAKEQLMDGNELGMGKQRAF